ncbi:hypothetical protein C5S35_15935 [Candidatus Methanophagaceae archaeon]|nr:hypothetical protein C5S35_15935 [Methanophagales archaeon]
MKKITFLELAKKVLREENNPMTVEEIWEFAQEKGYDTFVATKGKTPWRTIGAQIYTDIRDNDDSPFIKIDSKPRKFFLKELASEEDLKKIKEKEEKVVETPTKTKYSEKDLHPLLTYYAYTYMGIYTKTIRHQKSSKKTYAQWLHPDLVGVYFPIDEWTTEVLDFGMAVGSRLVKLYSFEMKTELTFSNIRESFFQTVSNSSWANEGYLVAPKISQDEEFMFELKRLSTSFGIGIIKIGIEDPDSSEILFPAKFKTELDWDTINKLAGENDDFKEFITRIKNDLSSKEVRKEKYDQVYNAEKLKEMIEK